MSITAGRLSAPARGHCRCTRRLAPQATPRSAIEEWRE